MKLSTKTRYGTRAMVDLALKYGAGPITAKEIAKEQQFSAKYLESLLAILGAAGLLRTIRGAKGGHVLARPPDQITLRELFEVLEGSDGFVLCTSDPALCERAGTCVTQEVWAEIHAASMSILESITLNDMVRRVRDKQASAEVMYYI